MPEPKDSLRSSLIELLKYPLLVFSILLAVVVAHRALELEFGPVTELSKGGIKFARSTDAALEALTRLEGQVSELTVRLEAVEESPPSQDVASRTRQKNSVESQVSVAAQSVSDATAEIARIQRTLPNAQALKGYIWIGDFDSEWDRASIVLPDKQPVQQSPDRIQVGSESLVLGNMVVRGGLPENDISYFRGRANVGIIPKGTTVRITRAPQGIDREFAVQSWAEVEEVTGD